MRRYAAALATLLAIVAVGRTARPLVPESEREDAVQVAWVAHLDGEDAGLAVKKWWMGTLRRRRREQTNLL